VDIPVFVGRCGKGGYGVDAVIAEARPVGKGDGGHFPERGDVMVEVALEPGDCKGVVEAINGWKGESSVM